MPSPETYILSESLSAFPDFLVKRSPSAPYPSSPGAKPFAENFHVLPPAMMRPDIAPDAADDILMSPADFSPSSANTCAANLPTAHGGRAAKSYARAHVSESPVEELFTVMNAVPDCAPRTTPEIFPVFLSRESPEGSPLAEKENESP